VGQSQWRLARQGEAGGARTECCSGESSLQRAAGSSRRMLFAAGGIAAGGVSAGAEPEWLQKTSIQSL